MSRAKHRLRVFHADHATSHPDALAAACAHLATHRRSHA